MKKAISIFFIAIMLQYSVLPCFAGNVLERGTVVKVRTTTTISSNSNNLISAVVDANVYDVQKKDVLIKAGTPVNINVEAKKAKAMGKAGHIYLKGMTTTSVDGQIISLSGGMNQKGDSKAGLAVGLGLGTGLTVLPIVGFFFFLIKGENVEIPSETLIPNVVVAEEYTIK